MTALSDPFLQFDIQCVIDKERESWRTARVIDSYVFHVKPVVKGRARGTIAFKGARCVKCKRGTPYPVFKTPQETLDYEIIIARETESQACCTIAPTQRLGARITFFCNDTKGDLSNLWKSVEDGMNRFAYEDDKQFDYSEPLRIVTDTIEPHVRVEILATD